jgi:hypothetical protein
MRAQTLAALADASSEPSPPRPHAELTFSLVLSPSILRELRKVFFNNAQPHNAATAHVKPYTSDNLYVFMNVRL